MKKFFRISLSAIILLVLSACNLFGTPQPIFGENSVLKLSVQTQNGVNTFSKAGDVINYNYVVTNTGSSRLAGPVIVTDPGRSPACPDVTTVGNGDIYLDLNESITCAASYTATQADVTTGSITNLATATAGGVGSNQAGVTITLGSPQASTVLTLTKTASPQTYGQVGQQITYTYTLTNIGTTPLGPAQFIVSDNKLTAPLACGQANVTIAPNQPLNCSALYTITQADMAAPNVTNTASATGASQTTASVTTTITNLTVAATQTPTTIQTATPAPPSNLTPGSTIQHQVAVGEWLIQIARCYGATFEDVRNANLQIADPNFILPSMIVTVPRIGSAGRIYGKPCVTFYTVVSGDTWEAIAQRNNADLTVLHRVNPVALTAGTVIKIPLNSAGSLPAVVTPNPGTPYVPPPTTSTSSQRINIPTGQTTASITGIVSPNQTVQYVVAATEGQVLTINLIADPNEIYIAVNGPTGIALKPSDAAYQWTTTVTTSGDHYINITSAVGTSMKAYTLQVTLTASTTPGAPTATSTNTPNTPSP